MMKWRVFVAIPVPQDIKDRVVEWQKAHEYLKIRWIKPENLHITVVPPWYITEDKLSVVKEVLINAIGDFESFEVKFDKILFGPPKQPPRLIWAEGNTPKEFVEFRNRLENELLKNPLMGFFQKESRLAKLHLTIARFRPGSIKESPLNGVINWGFPVREINLMKSELKRTGAEYTTLKNFRF